MATTDEKRKTLNNQKAEIKDARVIANYGDPGLDEDYHFDILSRFVVVKLESCDRTLTEDKWFTMLAVVQRPAHLWINLEGGLVNPAEQKRTDFLGNINAGLASSYSSSAIGRMNEPYKLGELIKIRKLPQALKAPDSVVLSSRDPAFVNTTYGSWHTAGSSLPYFVGNSNKIAALQRKCINPQGSYPGFYDIFLSKYHYEAFMLTLNASNSDLSNALMRIFDGSWGGDSLVYSAHGGYLFYNNTYCLLSSVEYEDINMGNKQRVQSSDCLPLVVATPNSFPTAKTRAVGTISYNPTYSTIVKG